MLKFKNILFAAFTLSLVNFSFAQKGTQSPYSSFGLGELNAEGYAAFSSMGGVSIGNTDSTIVNTSNPASYSYIGRNMPIFQLGMNGKLSTFSTAEGSSDQRHFGLNQFQLGLPINKNWGAAIGLKPYTFTGYTITNYTVEDTDTTMQYVSEGSGGVRIANFGLSYRPLNMRVKDTIYRKSTIKDTITNEKFTVIDTITGFRTNNLSFGFNGNYLFGTSKHIRSTEFIPSSASIFNARVEDGLRVSGLSWQFGVNYQFGFKSANLSQTLSVGATFSPASEVKAFQDLYSYSYVGSFYRGESVAVLDTIEFIQDNEGKVLKPESYALGLEYRVSPFNSGSMIRIGLDVKMEKWSTFYTEFSGLENPGGLKDRLSAGVGLEWTPKAGLSSLDQSGYLSRVHYRLGFNYTQTELSIENNIGEEVEINNYGMSFGLGLPITTGRSNTNINFGASLGNLGTTDNGLIQEQYMGIYVGFSITPQLSNRWFVKRKYN